MAKLTGIERIAAERQRQVEKLGWTPEHDDHHSNGEMALAAVCYATPEQLYLHHDCRDRHGPFQRFLDPWPRVWSPEWDKRPRGFTFELVPPTPAQRIRMLEKAGALLAAEIDRLLRAGAAARAAGRCSVCGSKRIRQEDGSLGACSLVPGIAPENRGCPDPLYDLEQERAEGSTP